MHFIQLWLLIVDAALNLMLHTDSSRLGIYWSCGYPDRIKDVGVKFSVQYKNLVVGWSLEDLGGWRDGQNNIADGWHTLDIQAI